MLNVRAPPISMLLAIADEMKIAAVTSTAAKDRANMDTPSQVHNVHPSIRATSAGKFRWLAILAEFYL
jgi:hypothetical protein